MYTDIKQNITFILGDKENFLKTILAFAALFIPVNYMITIIFLTHRIKLTAPTNLKGVYMKFNLLDSFVYIFRDKSWVLKFLCIIGLFLVYALVKDSIFSSSFSYKEKIYFLIFSFLIPCLVFGNIALNANARIYLNNNELYNWRGNFLKILSASFSLFLVAVALAALDCYLLYDNMLNTLNSPTHENFLVKSYVIHFAFMLMLFLGYLSFIKDLKFVSFFNLKQILKILTKNFGLYFIGLIVIHAVLIFLIGFIGKNPVGGVTLLFFFPYMLYVLSDVNAQFLREIFELK